MLSGGILFLCYFNRTVVVGFLQVPDLFWLIPQCPRQLPAHGVALRFSQTLTATSFPSHLLVHHCRTKGFVVRLMLSFFLWYPAVYLLLSKTLVFRLESPSIISFSICKYEEDFMDSPKNKEHRAPTLHLWSTMTCQFWKFIASYQDSGQRKPLESPINPGYCQGDCSQQSTGNTLLLKTAPT